MKGKTIMIIGHIIKRERLNNKIKQTYLANGICSPSYLSKIENNETIPSNEILSLLFEKLGISHEINFSKSEIREQQLKDNLLEVYKQVTINRNKDFASEKMKYFYNNRFQYIDTDIFYTFNLIMMRLILSNKADLNLLDSYLQPLKEDIQLLNPQQLFLLKKLEGIYLFQLKDYSTALLNFNEAFKIKDEKLDVDWELADFYFMYSLVNLATDNNMNAIEFSQKARNYYLENFQFRRAIECYTVQAISYKKSNKIKEALDIYLKVKLIIEEFNLNEYNPLLFQNLGSLYSSLGELTEALNYYSKSLNLKKQLNDRLISVFSIVQIYSRLKNTKDLITWIDTGLNMVEDNKDLLKYRYHFLFYKELSQEESQSDLKLMTDIIQFFESENDYRHVYKYCIKMGDVLINRNKYKDASFFYKKALVHNNKQQNYTYWEDI